MSLLKQDIPLVSQLGGAQLLPPPLLHQGLDHHIRLKTDISQHTPMPRGRAASDVTQGGVAEVAFLSGRDALFAEGVPTLDGHRVDEQAVAEATGEVIDESLFAGWPIAAIVGVATDDGVQKSDCQVLELLNRDFADHFAALHVDVQGFPKTTALG